MVSAAMQNSKGQIAGRRNLNNGGHVPQRSLHFGQDIIRDQVAILDLFLSFINATSYSGRTSMEIFNFLRLIFGDR